MSKQVEQNIANLHQDCVACQKKLSDISIKIEQQTAQYQNFQQKRALIKHYEEQIRLLRAECDKQALTRQEYKYCSDYEGYLSLSNLYNKDIVNNQEKIKQYQELLQRFEKFRYQINFIKSYESFRPEVPFCSKMRSEFVPNSDTSIMYGIKFEPILLQLNSYHDTINGLNKELSKVPNGALYDQVRQTLIAQLNYHQESCDKLYEQTIVLMGSPTFKNNVLIYLIKDLLTLLSLHTTDCIVETYDGGEMGQPRYGGKNPDHTTLIKIDNWVIPSFSNSEETPCLVRIDHHQPFELNPHLLKIYADFGITFIKPEMYLDNSGPKYCKDTQYSNFKLLHKINEQFHLYNSLLKESL